MRKTILPIALALAVAGSWTLAQAGDDAEGPRGPGMEHRIDRMLDKVDATDAQRTQIEAIAQKYQPQMKSLHEQMRALREQMRGEIDGVLTAEQKQKLDAEKAKFRHRHHRREKREG